MAGMSSYLGTSTAPVTRSVIEHRVAQMRTYYGLLSTGQGLQLPEKTVISFYRKIPAGHPSNSANKELIAPIRN